MSTLKLPTTTEDFQKALKEAEEQGAKKAAQQAAEQIEELQTKLETKVGTNGLPVYKDEDGKLHELQVCTDVTLKHKGETMKINYVDVINDKSAKENFKMTSQQLLAIIFEEANYLFAPKQD